MTTAVQATTSPRRPPATEPVIDLLVELAGDLPPAERHARLLHHLRRLFPCDAAALLRLEDGVLYPVAVEGLSEDTLGRRFPLAEHPRLARLVAAEGPVRFDADGLPDPYDGLVDASPEEFEVHDCMGAALRLNGRVWGVMTLDALRPGAFDGVDPAGFAEFTRLAAASVGAAEAMVRLSREVQQERDHRHVVERERASRELIGHSAAMQELKRLIATVAASDLTVLVLGETGTGKELVANRIHADSLRAARPLVHVNCAALPETLAESELFGHTRGAFTGAVADRRGRFELADGGTLVLDEIGELPLALQAKLLRVLQSGEVQRVGSDRSLRVDVRVIASTNRDLAREVAEGRFRADLFHRLSVFPLTVPPLRARGRDVLEIAGRFLENNQRRLNLRGLRLSAAAREVLLGYDWPGNVRELEHVLSRAALLAATQARAARIVTIEPAHLGVPLRAAPAPTAEPAAPAAPGHDGLTLAEATERFQVEWLRRVIDAHGGNLAAAARAAGMDRGNFHRLLKRRGLR